MTSMRQFAKKLRPLSDANIIYDTFKVGTNVKVYFVNKWYSANVLKVNWKNETVDVGYTNGQMNTLSWKCFKTKPNRQRNEKKMAWKLGKKRKYQGWKSKFKMLEKQDFSCKSCGNRLDSSSEVDHKKPLFMKVNNKRSNLQLLCKPCHKLKTREEFEIVKKIS